MHHLLRALETERERGRGEEIGRIKKGRETKKRGRLKGIGDNVIWKKGA